MKVGRPRNLETPEDFLSLWDEYKEHIDKNPDLIEKATNKGVQVERVKKPYTRMGFEAYVYRNYGFNIHQYIDNCNNKDSMYFEYLGVVTCAKKEWEDDQISGTMTGKYKAPNLTARLNGLTEKTDVTTNGKEINEIKVNIVRDGTVYK
jgi:hypothetical protein